MALSQHINDLITAYKAHPNGEWRNKVISHLKDAYAAALIVEREMNERHPFPDAQCICPEGARAVDCPVHTTK